MMFRIRIAMITTVLVTCMAMVSCTTTVGDARDQYRLTRKGNLWEVLVRGKVSEIHRAVELGVHSLGLKTVSNTHDQVSALVNGFFADQKEFNITLRKQSPGVVRMRIRVGIIGDEQRTTQLFQAIEQNFPRSRFSPP